MIEALTHDFFNKLLCVNCVWDLFSAVATWKGVGVHLDMFTDPVSRREQKLLSCWLVTYAFPRLMAGVLAGYDTLAALTYIVEGFFWTTEKQWGVAVLSYAYALVLVLR